MVAEALEAGALEAGAWRRGLGGGYRGGGGWGGGGWGVDDEIGGIAASIKEIEATGVRVRDQAVLCRTNARLNEIAQGLESRGIPVLHLGSLFERDEVRDLLALLAFIGDSSGMRSSGSRRWSDMRSPSRMSIAC